MKPLPRNEVLLLVGALSGIGLTAYDVARAPARAALPESVVATVNGRPIRREDFQSALAAVAADRRDGIEAPHVRRHVLDRLIDEELLVQAALELGLAERDRRVRADLTAAAIGFLTEAPSRDPSEAELRAFFAEHSGYFARDAKLELGEHYFARGVDDAGAKQRALAARRTLSEGGAGAALASDPPPLALPSGLLPLGKLEQYLGPSIVQTVRDLPVGGLSEPLARDGGYSVLRVLRRSEGAPPPFEQAREEVLGEWRRRHGEQSLREYLDSRRARANVEINGGLGS